MKKSLFIFCCLGILLFGLTLSQPTFAGATDDLECTNATNATPAGFGGTCETITSCPTTQGSPPVALDSASFDTTKKTACITEYQGTTKECTTGKCPSNTAWYFICCRPKTTGATSCTGSTGSCAAASLCPNEEKDQVTSLNSTCATNQVCCKPKCAETNCKASCSGTLEDDSSKASCADDKVCCKTKGTGGDGPSGGKTPGASYNLADYSPVGDVDIPTLIGYIIKGALGIIGSIALLMFVYGGFLMLISQGDAAKVKKGKDALVWAAAGLVVIFGSYIFVSYILTAITQGGPGAIGVDDTRPVPCPTDYPNCSDSATSGQCENAPANSTCTDGWCCK